MRETERKEIELRISPIALKITSNYNLEPTYLLELPLSFTVAVGPLRAQGVQVLLLQLLELKSRIEKKSKMRKAFVSPGITYPRP